MKNCLSLYLVVVFFACDRIDRIVEEDDQEFEVTVLGHGDCNRVQLAFRTDDEEALKKITGERGLTYHAVFPAKLLFQPNEKLMVKVRKDTNGEIPACPTFAPTDPTIFVVTFRTLE